MTLTQMEKYVREFSVVVTGAKVQGGFGELPHSTEDSQRISNLHRAIDQFELVGDGVNVSGSFEDGYVIS